jgi:hypothetical protein
MAFAMLRLRCDDRPQIALPMVILPRYRQTVQAASEVVNDRLVAQIRRNCRRSLLLPRLRRDRLALRCHPLLSDTLGRVIWSGKLAHALAQLRVSWPPFRAQLFNLKVRGRMNMLVFDWAVGERVAKYRRRLAAKPDRPNANI